MLSPNDGTDSLNLYDVSGLAHYELYHAIAQAGKPSLEVSQGDLLKDLNKQLTKLRQCGGMAQRRTYRRLYCAGYSNVRLTSCWFVVKGI